MRKMYFLAGLPRAGSTLILNVLGQNPAFHVTGTSGLIDLVNTVKTRAWELPAIKAMGDVAVDAKIIQAVRGLMEGFYSDVPQDKIPVDKSRGWEGNLETLKEVLGCEPKIICPVRDVREILASFEKLYRKTVTSRNHPDEKVFPFRVKTCEGRAMNLLLNEGGVLGVPINLIKDACARGWRKNLLFVDYAELTRNPGKVMQDIYLFLELPCFTHDFNNVAQITFEDDLVHVYKNLHVIRSKIEPVKSDWDTVLPKSVTDSIAADARFWEKL